MSKILERFAQEIPAFEEYLNETYGEDEWALATSVIVADVLLENGENPITFHSSDPRRWVQAALLTEGLARVEETKEREEEESGDREDS